MPSHRFYSLPAYFQQRFGHGVRKISLDAGSTCPNRDGTLSHTGCAFCNEQGSGNDLARTGLSLSGQYHEQWKIQRERRPNAKFMAYIQSFSNTYGPASRLQQMLETLRGLPDLVGVALGTRPDCLDEEKLELLRQAPAPEIWLDLGLQSMHERTLRRINRGHDAGSFAHWSTLAAERGIKVCAHVISGLPGEDAADFKQTLTFVNSLPVAGIKIHNLYVCRDTRLEQQWSAGALCLLSRQESLEWLVQGVTMLRPDIVIQRLNGDPSPEELVAPQWALDKAGILNEFRHILKKRNLWQGKALGLEPAPWFDVK